jgi:preprotein translocase subunit Sss1
MFFGEAEFLKSFLVVGAGAILLTFIGILIFRLAIPFIIERSGG